MPNRTEFFGTVTFQTKTQVTLNVPDNHVCICRLQGIAVSKVWLITQREFCTHACSSIFFIVHNLLNFNFQAGCDFSFLDRNVIIVLCQMLQPGMQILTKRWKINRTARDYWGHEESKRGKNGSWIAKLTIRYPPSRPMGINSQLPALLEIQRKQSTA